MSKVHSAIGTDPVDWQLSREQLSDELWDVLIIGAGPAGSAAAIHLSRLGHRVVMVDLAEFPREKVCGDCLLTDVFGRLEKLGISSEVRAAGHHLEKITLFSPSRIECNIPCQSITIRRPILDALLARRAVDEGATFARVHITDIATQRDETITAVSKQGDKLIRARYAILATGAYLGLANKLGVVTTDKPNAIAGRCYVCSSLFLDRLVLSYDREIIPGYGWIVPMDGGVYNVGCGAPLDRIRQVDLRGHFKKFISAFPLAREIFRTGEMLSPFRSGALRCGLMGTAAVHERSVLIAGETLGTTFMMTGEGIGQAMATGETAATVIDKALTSEDRTILTEYPSLLERRFAVLHKGYLNAHRRLSRVWFNDMLMSRIRKSAYLQQVCKNFIVDGGDPRQLYSIKNLLKSYIV